VEIDILLRGQHAAECLAYYGLVVHQQDGNPVLREGNGLLSSVVSHKKCLKFEVPKVTKVESSKLKVVRKTTI